MMDAVNAAHEMGLYVIVTDYLMDSPAKKIADEALMYSIDDVNGIVAWCEENKVDAVLNIFIDPAQIPYQQICEKLGLPCYGTEEQFRIMTNKSLFKELCAANGVDTIPQFAVDTIADMEQISKNEYPVYVKPIDKYASKGQSICYNIDELCDAIKRAKSISGSKTFLVERYMDGDDFTVKYRFDENGMQVLWTADRYLRRSRNGLGTVAIAHGLPSKHNALYFRNVHDKVCQMFNSIGMKTGEAFLQGFVDKDTIRFYDPAFRFSGGQTYRIIDSVFKTNQLKELIHFALTGEMNNIYSCKRDDIYLLNNKRAIFLMPTMRAGTISKILGMDLIKVHPAVIGVTQTHYVDDTIIEDGTAQQRIAYIAIVAENKCELIEIVEWVQQTLSVLGNNGEEMLTRDFDTSVLDY